jgi:two-component system phosphate regulon response regulator PhoB
MKLVSGRPVRILLVEDDPAHHALLVSWLKAEGYQVNSFHNGLEAQQYLTDNWADLAVLDWDIPGMSGDKLLQRIRGRSQSAMPVLFQTVHSAESDIVQILDAGADDYLVKPFDRQVLLARVRALLRRFSAANVQGRKMMIEDCVLDQQARSLVTAGGETHPLGTKEFDMLWHLASHLGAVVQRQDLMSVVWGWGAAVQSRSVDMYVSRVRSHLKAAGVRWTVQSVYATGYRLTLRPDGEGRPAGPESGGTPGPAAPAQD